MILFFSFENESDRIKFETIYEKYKNLMLHKAYHILHDYMLAEDAVSEAFIRLYKNIHKVDDPTSNQSVAFVMTIVKNASLTLLEKQKKTPVEEVDETQRDDFDLESATLSALSGEAIFSLVSQLGEELSSVFLLKYGRDLSHKEIGVMLGITENNVTVRLHRAKKKLAALLVKEGYAI